MESSKKYSNLYSTEVGRFLISLLLTGLLFGAVSLVSPRVFFINDDENIMYTLSGYYSYGLPTDHSFVNFCLSYILRFFYRVFPAIQWYGVFHMAVLIVSVTLIFKSVLRECYKNGFPFLWGFLADVLLFAAIYLFPTTLFQFTTTSAFAGAAACVLLLEADLEKDKRGQLVFDLIFSVGLFVLCYLHRKNTGYVVICFYLGTLAYHFLKLVLPRESAPSGNGVNAEKRSRPVLGRKKGFRNLLIVSISAALLLGSAIVADAQIRSTPDWDYFYEYDNARFKATDYPHDSYTENPELYESLDWTPELYELGMTNWWFLMDPRINAETFTAISETGYFKERSINLHEMLSIGKAMVLTNHVSIIATISCVVLGLIFLLLCIFEKNKKMHLDDILYGLGILFGSVLLCLFLCYRQRFPLRAFHTICLPFVSINSILIFRMFSLSDNGKKRKLTTIFFSILCCAMICVTGYINTQTTVAQAKDRVEKSLRTLKIEQYAMEHPENLYVYDVSLTFRYLPFTVYSGQYPSNLFFWGGMGWKSPCYYLQLYRNGLDELYSDVLFKDNVYYITWNGYAPKKQTMRQRLEKYMDATYGDCEFDLVESISNQIDVYKITQ